MKKILVWLRNDLRLHDNTLLHEATQKSEQVWVAYCIDKRLFAPNMLGIPKTGNFRAKFLTESLLDLRLQLRKQGSDLIVRLGKPEQEICKIAEILQVEAVFTSKEVTQEELEVETALEQNLTSKGIAIEYFWQATLYHINDLPFPVCKLPDIFTEFRKAVERQVEIRKPLPAPNKKISPLPENLFAGNIPTLKEVGLQEVEISPKATFIFKGGETEALKRLHYYLWESDLIASYKETRNGLLGKDYSSKFSPYLALGCISPRQIWQEVKKYEKERTANESTYWLIFELIWRDFFRFTAKKYGNRLFYPSGFKNEKLALAENTEIFWKWAKGETGVPFIDANMRELNATGFMSNRGRQNVASFLVKDLKISWIWGATYFESLLIDYDVCSNWGNWQYVAGVGNDPRENRYFNIISQAERYDSQAEFMKHWLPELQNVPSKKINYLGELSAKELAEYGVRIGVNYPKAIVKWTLAVKVSK
ncbi:MAG: DASH family cryptochrome [Raineya sp.]|nr:DASH family cryptochrome [Raineya sp.]